MGLNHFDWSQLGLLNYSGETDVLKPERNQQQQQQQVQQQQQQQQQRWPPLRCPRCDSTNTKFCYYNNYSKSQPRHLCKACRRHWTEGGTLRNVPVGGVRKNKRNTKKSTTTTPQTTTTAATNSNTTNNSNMATNCSTFAQRLVNGNPSSSALPEILRQAMLRASPPPPPLQFMPLDYGVVSSTPSTWDVAPPTQAAPVSNTGYWNWSGNWEDEVSCLVAPELMPPTTDDS